MKATSFALLCFVAAAVYAADVRIYSPDGRTLGYIEEDGRISGADGKTRGYLQDDGSIRSRSGRPLVLENDDDTGYRERAWGWRTKPERF